MNIQSAISVTRSVNVASMSYSFPVTVAAGTNRRLFVGIVIGKFALSSGNQTSPTFDGAAMTMVTGSDSGVSNGTPRSQGWVLDDPPVGTFNVNVTNPSNTNDGAYFAIVVDDVDTSRSPVGTYSTTAGNVTSFTPTVSAGAADLVFTFGGGNGGGTPNAASPATQIGSPLVIAASTSPRAIAGYLVGGAVTLENFTSGQGSATSIVIPGLSSTSGDVSGSASLGDVSASGGLSSLPSSTLSGGASLGDVGASGDLGVATGVITTPVLKNNTGTILASVSGVVANVYNPSTGALVVRKTGLSSDGSGIVTISDLALIPGTSYVYEIDLSAASLGRRLPVGIAA